MEIKGKVKHVGTTETVGSNGFQKRLIAVETTEQYPQTLGIEFVQDKTALLDSINLGDSVTIGINLRGREWTNPQGETKYFNSIAGWKIAVDSQAETNNESAQDGDDLPF
ncbi:hypothetical protein P12024L_21 [Nonlabens phage P12024L]|uniref:DUF3127 domain-containing protein n=1 Tax=Nonlabens phage P12024L TaxID=1168479 RepID=I6R165_9CAUD|nr:single strand DNA binding protein [Nonlabens phage P12024L]AFM54741.1 hypothetical protein P12024L_21 [Nonlabens phage P12024L]